MCRMSFQDDVDVPNQDFDEPYDLQPAVAAFFFSPHFQTPRSNRPPEPLRLNLFRIPHPIHALCLLRRFQKVQVQL